MMKNFEISLFKNKTDNKPEPATRNWQQLCERFQKPVIRANKDGALFAPAVFEPALRRKENVREISLLVLDIDHNAELEMLKEKLAAFDSAYAIYSTHSHLRRTETNPNAEPRFRVCLPLASAIPAADFPALWQYVKRKTDLPLDESAKDASRMFYTPAIAEQNAPYVFHIADGASFDWRTLPLESFSANGNNTNPESANNQKDCGGQEPHALPEFEFHEDRHAELCRIIEAQAKATGRGAFEMKCPAHNGNGNSSLFYAPETKSVKCRKGCDYFEILRAFGLSKERLPSHEKAKKIIEPQSDFTGEPKPLDLTLKPVATIDDECLAKVLTDWLRPASKVIGCPFDFLVLSAVVIVGSLIGSRLRVKPFRNSDWFVVPNLYGGCVGVPSTKKSPAIDETRNPILELKAAAREKHAAEKEDYDVEAKFYEKDASDFLRKSKNSAEYKDKLKDKSKPDQPILRRYETNSITTPKIAQFLAENPNGLLQYSDELIGWFKSLDADYELNGRSFILALWKGAIDYEQARVSTGEIYIKSGTLSVIGGIQPSKLERYIAEAYSFDNADGLAQRFLYSFPDFVRRKGKPTQADLDAMRNGYAAVNRLCKTITDYSFKENVTGANGDKFQIVKFSAEAQAAVDEWNDDIENEAESLQFEDEPFSSYLYKLPKSCFAIALIFHCLEHINNADFPDEISLETTLKAIAYTEVLTTHARRVFALGENQIFSLAQILLGKIKKGELEQGFTAYEIKRKQWSGIKTPDTINDVISLLVDYGYLREFSTDNKGRPTVKYLFHPSLEMEANNEVE